MLSLMVYIFVFNLGYGAMTFITASEILPPHARELGMRLEGPKFGKLFDILSKS